MKLHSIYILTIVTWVMMLAVAYTAELGNGSSSQDTTVGDKPAENNPTGG